MKNNVFFVSGTDTGVGKSYATGYLAKVWNASGRRTITQKLVQTGNTDVSEDIEVHRKIMGCGMLPEDGQKLTMPEIFTYPCSPHLASEIDGREIDFGKIEATLLSLEAARSHGLDVFMVMFNKYPQEEDRTVSEDTEKFLRDIVARDFPGAEYMEVPVIAGTGE